MIISSNILYGTLEKNFLNEQILTDVLKLLPINNPSSVRLELYQGIQVMQPLYRKLINAIASPDPGKLIKKIKEIETEINKIIVQMNILSLSHTEAHNHLKLDLSQWE